jgi:hypothetical protein
VSELNFSASRKRHAPDLIATGSIADKPDPAAVAGNLGARLLFPVVNRRNGPPLESITTTSKLPSSRILENTTHLPSGDHDISPPAIVVNGNGSPLASLRSEPPSADTE